MKTISWIIVTIGILVGSAGCIPTTTDIQVLNNDVNTLMERIDKHQETFMSGVDSIQEKVVTITTAMESANGGIEALMAGNDASVPFNPYAGLIDAVLKGALAITTVGGGAAGVVAVKRGNVARSIVSKVNTLAAKSSSSLGAELNTIVNGHG